MSLTIGPHTLANNVVLAPMSGISDLPFRRACARAGAGLVVSEMVASEELARARPDVVLRGAFDGDGLGPNVMQLAGREAQWMEEGARLAEAMGADIIDINMGCPARQVTGALSGSALMRDPEHALSLVAATLRGTRKPVTVKMRLGWDHESLNAPQIARGAEELGVAAITVHGRTRQQFYKGEADWAAVRATREAISLPLIVNGDIVCAQTAREALAQSGADGVMVGRASEGRPWLPGAIAQALATGGQVLPPSLSEQARGLISLYDETVEHYRQGHQMGVEAGERIGVRTARKHLAAFVDYECAGLDETAKRRLRGALCREVTPARVVEMLAAIGEGQAQELAAELANAA